MAGFEHGVGIGAGGRQEEPQEDKMPKGRTDGASWDGGGKYSCGADSGLIALMASSSATHCKPVKEVLFLSPFLDEHIEVQGLSNFFWCT